MPFDFQIPARGFWDVADKTPRERLTMLRDFLLTSTPNVAWDYTTAFGLDPECGTGACALGWYAYLTDRPIGFENSEFRITDDTAIDFFFNTDLTGKSMSEVTPTDVANAITQYLDKTGEQS